VRFLSKRLITIYRIELRRFVVGVDIILLTVFILLSILAFQTYREPIQSEIQPAPRPPSISQPAKVTEYKRPDGTKLVVVELSETVYFEARVTGEITRFKPYLYAQFVLLFIGIITGILRLSLTVLLECRPIINRILLTWSYPRESDRIRCLSFNHIYG